LRFALSALFWPSFFGGGRRKFVVLVADITRESLDKIQSWITTDKIKPVTDQVFPFDKVVEAFQRLKTGRARGKVIVGVAEERR